MSSALKQASVSLAPRPQLGSNNGLSSLSDSTVEAAKPLTDWEVLWGTDSFISC